MLDGAGGRGADARIGAEDVEDLAPEPLAGIDAPLVGGVVGSVAGMGGLVDAVCLLEGRVVLPEDEHGVGVVGELGAQGEREAGGVREAGRRAGGVDSDAGDGGGVALGEGLADGVRHRLDIVEGVLAEAAGRRVGVASLAPARIGADGLHQREPLLVDEEGADAVASEIQSEVGRFFHCS